MGSTLHEDLKQKGNKTALFRSVCGLVGGLGLFAIFYVDIFGAKMGGHMKMIGLAAAVSVVVMSIVAWVRASKGSMLKGIEKFCRQSPDPAAMMARMEQVWNEGRDFGEGRMDSEYILCLTGMSAEVVPLEGVAWVYKRITRQGGAVFVNLMLVYEDAGYRSCKLCEGSVDGILGYITEHRPDVVVGFEKEYDVFFARKDMGGLRQYARGRRNEAGKPGGGAERIGL